MDRADITKALEQFLGSTYLSRSHWAALHVFCIKVGRPHQSQSTNQISVPGGAMLLVILNLNLNRITGFVGKL